MKVAFSTNYAYTNPNNTRQNQSFKSRTPKEVTKAFQEIRTLMEKAPKRGTIEPIVVNCSQEAQVVAERKNGNWILSFIALLGNSKVGITNGKGVEKNTFESILKDPKVRKRCYEFFEKNGIRITNASA